MKGIKSLLLLAGVVALLYLSDCKQAEVYVPFNTTEQYTLDSTALADYLVTAGIDYSLLDTLTTQVLVSNDTIDRIRSIYAILDEGAGESLEFDDIVSYNFNIRTLDDSVRATNIISVAVEYDLYDSSYVSIYSPWKFTLASSGWTVAPLFSNISTSLGSLDGPYAQALATVVAQMNVGGHAVILFLSPLYYDSFSTSSIYYVDIYTVAVRKPNS